MEFNMWHQPPLCSRKQHEYSGPSHVNTAEIPTHATAQKCGEPVPLKSFSTTDAHMQAIL